MSIKKKLPFIFTILIFGILLSNNVFHYFRSKEELLRNNEREITLIEQELTSQVQQAKEGSLFVEDILGKELRIASIAIKKSLPPRHEDITNEQLQKLSDELMISHITLLSQKGDDIVGVKSSDPHEINMSTKDWGYWFQAFNQLLEKKHVDVGKGLSLPFYWSGPMEVASSNPNHIDKWGYYYDASTNYIIDPYLRDDQVLDYANRFGAGKIIERFTKTLDGVLELTVFNPEKFGEKDDVVHLNGNSYIRISSQPIWYGTYQYENLKRDQKYIRKAAKTGENQSYKAKLNGKTVQKTFVPVGTSSDDPFVIGLAYDYGIIEKQLEKELLHYVLLSAFYMVIVLFTSLFLSNRIAKPLGFIAGQVNEISKGKFGKTIEINRKDELGSLASDVNAMSSSLKAYVDDLKESREIIKFQANHDPLTALPNRRFAGERMNELLIKSMKRNDPVSIIFIDIDRFKNVNDSLGHDKGDELIVLIAERLKSVTSGCAALISRQGGDEFVVAIEKLSLVEIRELGNQIVESIKEPFVIEGHEIFIGASCGISLYPTHSEGIDELIKYADIAMYEAKSLGGNTTVIYSSEFSKKNQDKMRMESRLRRAISDEKIEVHYQPKVNVKTGRIIGAEALVRWKDEELGTVSPSDFIPIAEEMSLIQPMWELVMKKACSQAKMWNDASDEPIAIAVNFSSKQFQHTSSMVKKVKEIMDEGCLPPELFEIEITESVLLYNTKETIEALRELRELGIKISVDDFGTGYSSLSYLKQFPIDTLKIDQSFIHDIDDHFNHTEITDAIIHLAKGLRLQVVAEGVEKEYQIRYLLKNGCTIMQGYFFSKPLSAEEFELLLKKQGLFTLSQIDVQRDTH